MEIAPSMMREAAARGMRHMLPTEEPKSARLQPTRIMPVVRTKVLRRDKREAAYAFILSKKRVTITSICSSLDIVRTEIFPTLRRWQELSIIRRLPHSTLYEPLKNSLPANDV